MTERPAIVGIVNITPDSFSDGGRFLDPERAARHARQLLEDGARIVDLGPASSHPDAPAVSPEQEIERLAPVLDRLEGLEANISIDSDQPETQRYALERGVGWLNDIRGFPDASLYPSFARASCTLVVMHNRLLHARTAPAAEPAPDADDAPEAILTSIRQFSIERLAALERAGVERKRLVLDPGMGLFLGATPEASLAVLRALGALRQELETALLIGVSRKSFLGAITGRPITERAAATLAAELFAARAGVDYIRTHDVRALRDGLAVERALRADSLPRGQDPAR